MAATTFSLTYAGTTSAGNAVTAPQDAALTYLRTLGNITVSAQIPNGTTFADNPTFLVALIEDLLTKARQQHLAAKKAAIDAAVDSATAAQLTAVGTDLGVTLP